MKKTALIVSLVSTLAAFGCGKGDGSGGGGGKAEPLVLDKLGVTLDAPKGATQSEMLGDIMVTGPGLVVSVREAKDTDPKTPADAKEEASMYSPTNTSDEKLDDGFVFRFENKGGAGANYFVNVRREIDGKAYFCTTTAPNSGMADSAVAACKSLRK